MCGSLTEYNWLNRTTTEKIQRTNGELGRDKDNDKEQKTKKLKFNLILLCTNKCVERALLYKSLKDGKKY